jgi:hypothetical protein
MVARSQADGPADGATRPAASRTAEVVPFDERFNLQIDPLTESRANKRHRHYDKIQDDNEDDAEHYRGPDETDADQHRDSEPRQLLDHHAGCWRMRLSGPRSSRPGIAKVNT